MTELEGTVGWAEASKQTDTGCDKRAASSASPSNPGIRFRIATCRAMRAFAGLCLLASQRKEQNRVTARMLLKVSKCMIQYPGLWDKLPVSRGLVLVPACFSFPVPQTWQPAASQTETTCCVQHHIQTQGSKQPTFDTKNHEWLYFNQKPQILGIWTLWETWYHARCRGPAGALPASPAADTESYHPTAMKALPLGKFWNSSLKPRGTC